MGGLCDCYRYRPEFDSDLEVKDIIFQNVVSHQKHGSDPVILRVVVRVK